MPSNISLAEAVGLIERKRENKRLREQEEQQRQTSLSLADIIGQADIVKSNSANLNSSNIDQAPGFLEQFGSIRQQILGLGLGHDDQLKVNEAISTMESTIRNNIANVQGGINDAAVGQSLVKDLGLPIDNTLNTIGSIEDPVEQARAFTTALDSTFGKEFAKNTAVIRAQEKNIEVIANNKKKLGEIDNLLAAQRTKLLDAAVPKEDKEVAAIEVFNKSLDAQTGAYKDVRKELLTTSKQIDDTVNNLSGNTELGTILRNTHGLDSEQGLEINNRSMFGMFEANGGDDAAVDEFFADQNVPEEVIQSVRNDYDLFRQSADQGLKNALAAEGSNLLQIFQLQETISNDLQVRFALDKAQGIVGQDAEIDQAYITRTFPNMPQFLSNSLESLNFKREAEDGEPIAEDVDLESEDSSFLTKVLKKISDPVKEAVQSTPIPSPFKVASQAAALKQTILGDNTQLQSVEDVFDFVSNSNNIKQAIKSGTVKAETLFNRLLEKGLVADKDFANFVKLFRKEQKDNPQLTNANR